MGGRPEWVGIPGTAYYNEIDPVAAKWLRNLIKAGRIAPGVVDERSIVDIIPEELNGFVQCHFFAGVGVWSYALRLAGWPDDRPIWTGSCPCQPFSAAGKGAGFLDERHLWPAFNHLIRECKPECVTGEQVASSAVDAWIDLVHADLEALGYAFGSVPFPSAGVGAPHIRERNYWVAESSGQRRQRGQGAAPGRLANRDDAGRIEGHDGIARVGETGVRLADASDQRQRGRRAGGQGYGRDPARQQPERLCDAGRLGNAISAAGERNTGSVLGEEAQVRSEGFADGHIAVGLEHAGASLGAELAGPTNGFWRDADWLGCRDGKWRPVEPGTFPLAHGATNRVGRLRAYGNAINAVQARVFIEAFM